MVTQTGQFAHHFKWHFFFHYGYMSSLKEITNFHVFTFGPQGGSAAVQRRITGDVVKTQPVYTFIGRRAAAAVAQSLVSRLSLKSNIGSLFVCAGDARGKRPLGC